MAQVVLYIAVSLDGFIADREGGVHWLAPFDSSEYGYDEFVAEAGTLIMGRTTYEQVRAFGDWPYAGKRVVVMTRRPLPTPPPGVEAWHGDSVAELVADINGQAWLVGGAEAVREFFDHGLIDHLRLFIIPVLLGDGIRLFQGSVSPTTFPLVNCQRFSTGVVELEYGSP